VREQAAKSAHEATLQPVENQMALGAKAEYEWCCDRNSQDKYPDHPPCTCNPENWNAFVCSPVDDNHDPYWPAQFDRPAPPVPAQPHAERVVA
jgi:hypothetical protein